MPRNMKTCWDINYCNTLHVVDLNEKRLFKLPYVLFGQKLIGYVYFHKFVLVLIAKNLFICYCGVLQWVIYQEKMKF